MASTTLTAAPPPGLQEAQRLSTLSWQKDLQSLFDHTKDRFPDVVWELSPEEDDGMHQGTEEVWGHKAIVYARAPPSFQARYFSFRPPPVASPAPYASSPIPNITQSALSLDESLYQYSTNVTAPNSTQGTAVLRIHTTDNPALFSNELEYLYTGKGFGEAFEFLFDTPEKRDEGDAEENRIDKLRKDLVFMWRSRLYSDIRIALSGTFASTNHEPSTAIFSSHRFILASRSPYFYSQLLTWGTPVQPKSDKEPLMITLPSPPFTPAALHFTLGYIYTGTLIFSHRNFDLETAFAIMRSATYLSLDALYTEIQARIIVEMMHGLFHAFLEFSEYESITAGRWGTGGSRCRQCARRAPRVLEFALADDVKNPILERGARRALVGMYGEGWCTSEFAALPVKLRESLLRGLAKRTTPLNVFAMLFASEHALEKMKNNIDSWADVVRDMIVAGRKAIDDCLCNQTEACFEQDDWMAIMESDGSRFEDAEQVRWTMDSIRRGLSERNAPLVYQTLVSSILLRPHATESDCTMLSPTSHIRIQVEETRMDVIRWIRKRWVGIRQEGAFDLLQNWAIKEISEDIEVPVEDLAGPTEQNTNVSPNRPRTLVRPSAMSKTDTETGSMHSVRTSLGPRTALESGGSKVGKSSSSVYSVARSTLSAHPSVRSPPLGARPDSKLTPSTSVLSSTRSSVTSPIGNRRSTPSRSLTSSSETRVGSSKRSLVPSVHSRASTVRDSKGGEPSDSQKHRPTSGLSIVTDSTTFLTAPELPSASATTPRSRKTSATSTVSNMSARTTGGISPATTARVAAAAANRPRRLSAASATSMVSTKGKKPSSAASVRAPGMSRPVSNASIRSTTSTTSPAAKRKPSGGPAKTPVSPALLPMSKSVSSGSNGKGKEPVTTSVKGKAKETSDNNKHTASASTESTATIKKPARKTSTETITKTVLSSSTATTATVKTAKTSLTTQPPSATGTTPQKSTSKKKAPASSNKQQQKKPVPPALPPDEDQTVVFHPQAPSEPSSSVPRGATLEIGIPCIISSKRKRFRAYARYIGEVEGERGPWVGVEVPVGDSWPGDSLEGRNWNDGSWGGVRYFEISNIGSEFEYGDERVSTHRRRLHNDFSASTRSLHNTLKREGDYLSVDRSKRIRSSSPTVSDVSMMESRGLFVRPQQVLYVIDAVGADL